jgi:dTDP-4-dehydrorhamnose 3,5-epimerase
VKVETTDLPGVLLLTPRVFRDDRGFFLEAYNAREIGAAGLPTEFVQDNHSRSLAGVVRGFHYQLTHPQGKLVRVARGAIFDVVLDIRLGSPTFGQWIALELTDEQQQMVWVPAGFAHAFCCLRDDTDVIYKCTEFYSPDDEHGVLWNDPDLAIQWPAIARRASGKDANYQPLRARRTDLPRYQP